MSGAGWTRRDARWFLLALGWLVLTIGVRHLAIPDEGRYVSSAWEMVVSGNWLYPTIDGLPFFHKPPLYYWITGASLALLGPHEWAGRLAAVTGAAVAAFTLFGFALRQATPFIARLALLVLVTMPLFYASAQFATLDMLVGGFISATTLLAGEAAINAAAGRPYRGLLASAYLCAALGLLAKGLMGMVLPGLAIVVWLLWNRRPALLLKLLWLPGLALFALVAAPWFVAMQRHFPGFFHYFFVHQQFERYAEAGFNNPQPFWFYVPVLMAGLLPWSLLLLAALRARPPVPAGSLSPRSLMWIAAGVIVVFFSIPTSKMVGYVLGAIPPLAFLAAEAAGQRWQDPSATPRALRWFTAVGAVACLALLTAGRLFPQQSNASLGARIAAQRNAGEPVYFVKYQFLDLPFYLRLREPVAIFDDWQYFAAKQAGTVDDWRQTMFDAAKFDRQRADVLLPERAGLPQVLCRQEVAWVIVKKPAAAMTPPLPRLTPTFTEGDRIVYRTTSGELAAKGLCPQTPNGGSSGTSGQPQPPG